MYEISLSPKAQRNLKNLSHSNRKRVFGAIDELTKNPYPKGKKVKKLTAVPAGWRLRVGKIRLLYTIEDKTIRIYTIEKRGDVY